METLEEPTFPSFEAESMYSALEYPASRPPLPGSEEAHAMTVGSGRQLSMLLDLSSPLGAFSKILLESSHWTNSEEYCYVWNRLDTPFELSAFQLTASGPSTEDNESSLWPTATANCLTGGGTQGRDGGLNLQTAAKLWPTPIRKDAEEGSGRGHHLNPKADAKAGIRLKEAAAKLWPTPQAHDAHQGDPKRVNRFGTKHGGRNLNDEMADSSSGSLNPRFVEELMGFSIDHTALKHSATQSFRNKPTRSSKQSHK